MGEIIPFPASVTYKVTTDSLFGGCPHCGHGHSYLNVGRDHWSYCAEHKTKWCIGSNLFSGWQEETEEDWKRNEYRLAECMTVKPVYEIRTEDSFDIFD